MSGKPSYKYITIYHVTDGTRYYLNYKFKFGLYVDGIQFIQFIQFYTSCDTKGVFRYLLDADLLQVYVNQSWRGIKYEPRKKKFLAKKSCEDDSCVRLANQTNTDNYITVFADFDTRGLLNVLASLKFARGKNLTQVTSIVDIQTNKTNPDYSWVIEEVENPTQVTSIGDIQRNKTNPDYSWVIEEVENPTKILLPILLILLL